jgi:hypothetical protein
MSYEGFLSELEAERAWREEEIRFLDNNQRAMGEVGEREMIRRSIICVLYAHIEGYVHFSFNLYVNKINDLNIKCSDAKPILAAAVLNNEIKYLIAGEKKSPIFNRSMPDDSNIHSLYRREEFIKSLALITDSLVKIPDGYINTENNVGREVVEKLLYKVGLEYDDLSNVVSELTQLLNARNDIAHGKRRHGIVDRDYDRFLNCARDVINRLSHKLSTAYGQQHYLNTPHGAG